MRKSWSCGGGTTTPPGTPGSTRRASVLLAPSSITPPIAAAGLGPSVAWNGRRYLVSWIQLNDTRDIHAVRVAKGKADIDPIVVASGPEWKMRPEIASDGDNFFVGWSDERSGSMEVFGARVGDNGKVLDPGGVLVLGASDYDYLSGLVWDEQHYVVASGLWLIRVTCRAGVVDPNGVAVETPAPWLVAVTDIAAGSAGRVALLLNRSRPEAPYNGGTQAVIRFAQEPYATATLAVGGQGSDSPAGKGGEGPTARC